MQGMKCDNLVTMSNSDYGLRFSLPDDKVIQVVKVGVDGTGRIPGRFLQCHAPPPVSTSFFIALAFISAFIFSFFQSFQTYRITFNKKRFCKFRSATGTVVPKISQLPVKEIKALRNK